MTRHLVDVLEVLGWIAFVATVFAIGCAWMERAG